MTGVLLDTSVLVKWFHAEGESELEAARSLRRGHHEELIEARILDLALYELGNVLLRSLRWEPVKVTDQLEDLLTICGPAISFDSRWLGETAALAARFRLTFYDAAWAGAARALGAPLVSSARDLLAAGLAQSPGTAAHRLGLIS